MTDITIHKLGSKRGSDHEVIFSLLLLFLFLSIVQLAFSDQLAIASIAGNPFESQALDNFNFVVAGDFGCDDAANGTVNNMVKRDPELVLALGDLSYEKTAQCWLDIVSPLDDLKVKISMGEHDLKNNLVLYNAYVKHFNVVKPFYSFDYQNVHFLAMATGKNKIIPYNTTSAQYQFVKDDLERAHNDKNIDWIIVYQFRSFYSSLSTHPGLDVLHEAYHPLFEKYGVDLVFQAHNHNYQRTYPIAYNERFSSSPIVIDKHPNNYDGDSSGQIFLTVGTGGRELHPLLEQAPYVVSQFGAHGFLDVEMTDGGKKLTGRFYENSDGKILDQFSITKD